MEIIGVILFLIAINVVWRLVVSGGSSAIHAMQGKGSFSDNMSAHWGGIRELQVRHQPFKAGDDGEGPEGIGIEIKGIVPLARATNIGFVTSVIDMTDKQNPEPVLSELDVFQEPGTAAYMHLQPVGRISPGQGFISWVRIGVVFPELLYPGRSGRRNLAFVLRMIDLDNPPTINLGFSDSKDHPGLIVARRIDYQFEYSGTGYLEAAMYRDEARALAIRLGIAIAVADGGLVTTEGTVIKEWITKTIAPYGTEKREMLKAKFNDTLRSAYAASKAGDLSIGDVTSRLQEIAEEPQKYEAIELCFDVMAADGVADEEEMATIRRIAEALDLDYKEIENLRDKKLIALDVSASNQASMEAILGIDESWSTDRIKAHVRAEFAKWNDRLNNLPNGHEREAAQRMLDLLSEARKKYV